MAMSLSPSPSVFAPGISCWEAQKVGEEIGVGIIILFGVDKTTTPSVFSLATVGFRNQHSSSFHCSMIPPSKLYLCIVPHYTIVTKNRPYVSTFRTIGSLTQGEASEFERILDDMGQLSGQVT